MGKLKQGEKNVFYLSLAVQRRSQEMLMLKHGAGAKIMTLSLEVTSAYLTIADLEQT